jgi:integrase
MVDAKGPAGERLRISTGETDKAKAELKAAELITKAHREAAKQPLKVVPPKPGRMSFGKLLGYVERRHWEKLRSYSGIKYAIADLIAKLGEVPIEEVSYAVLSSYCDERSAAGDSNATLNRRMTVASRALREAERMGWLLAGPRVPRYREDPPEERYITENEEKKLAAAIKRHCSEDRPEWVYLAALFPLLLDTGMRLNEALSLTQANYRPSSALAALAVAHQVKPKGTLKGTVRKAVRVLKAVPEVKQQPAAVVLSHGTTKSGKGRHVPLTPRAEAALLLMLASPVHGKVRGDGLYQRFIRACNEAGIEGVKLHTCRHTCASRLVQKGVDLYRVQRWLGHSSPTLTMRYSHLRDDDLADAALALTR